MIFKHAWFARLWISLLADVNLNSIGYIFRLGVNEGNFIQQGFFKGW